MNMMGCEKYTGMIEKTKASLEKSWRSGLELPVSVPETAHGSNSSRNIE